MDSHRSLLHFFLNLIRSLFSCIHKVPPPPPDKPANTNAKFLSILTAHPELGSITKTPLDQDFKSLIRPWNLRCQPIPLAIIYPRTAADISLALRTAAPFNIRVQPRSGGHSFGSYSLGGTSGALIIDLTHLSHIRVDQKTWNAYVGGGARLGAVTKELDEQGGRAIAHGTCPQVGIGGHATIGGEGPLTRMWGLTLDHIIDMEVVLADGTITRANQNHNPDLFWAMRGAGSSFGIVTEFVFKTYEKPKTMTHFSLQITIGSASDLANAFLKWQTFVSQPAVLADRAFNSVISITRSAVLIQGTRFGTRGELEDSEIYVHLRELGVEFRMWELDWLASLVHWATDEVYTITGGISIPLYTKSFVLKESHPLTPETVQKWFNYIQDNTNDGGILVILADLAAGRVNDFKIEDTAFAQRDGWINVCAYGIGTMPFPDDMINFLNGMIRTIRDAQPETPFGGYPGYVDPLQPKSEWPRQFYGDNYPRLREIKRKYDPGNVFANPQSVGSDEA